MTSPPREQELTRNRLFPVLFVGHGSPMNVIEDNPWSRGFASLSALLPSRPRAILVVSAHWFVSGTFLTGDLRPRTIHDFSGFPPELYAIDYPAPGDVDLAQRVRRLLGEERATLSTAWGFDHGNWGVLRGMFPEATVPVIQLSLDRRLSPREHLELARSLRPLREEGVLILGSGNLVHNLRDAIQRFRARSPLTPAWALRFDQDAARAAQDRDARALTTLLTTDDGRAAHPSPDHYLPLLYAFGASDDGDRLTFPIEGFDLGSVSMRSFLFA